MIEQTIRSELNRSVRPGGAGDLDAVLRRGRSLRRQKALTRGAVATVVVAVVTVGIGPLTERTQVPGPSTVADGMEDPAVVTVNPGLEIPVEGTSESFGGIDLHRGRVGPAPQFQPAGTEQPLVVREEIEPPVDLLYRADVVYAGTAGGVDVFLQPPEYAPSGLIGWIDRVFDGQQVDGLGIVAWEPATERYNAGELLGATRPTGAIGGPLTSLEAVGPGVPPELGSTFFAWPATPDGTSVVVLLRDGEPVHWQRPVAGVAMFVLGEGVPTTGLEMVAYDVAGSAIGAVD